MIADERFYSSIVQSEDRRRDAGGHRQGRADASGQEPGRACGSAARRWRTRRSASACRSTSRARAFPRASRPRAVSFRTCVSDVEITCLPKDLPEFLEVDLSGMNLNETKFLADVAAAPGRDDSGACTPQRSRWSRSMRRVPRSPSRWPPRLQQCPPRVRAPAAGAGRCAGGRGAPAAAGDAKKGEEKKEAAPAKKEGGKK